MPATVRDILLMIRAKEDVTRTMGKVSGAMRGAAAQAQAAGARARAAALRAQAQQMQLTGATRAQVMAVREQARAYDEQAREIENANRRSRQLATAMQDVGNVMQTTGLVMLGMAAGGVYAMNDMIKVATAWDRQVRLTYTQVDKRFKPSLESLSNIGLRVSHDIAVPFETIQDALFDVFSSTEANMPQAEALLRQFSKAAVAGQTDIQTASRATIGLMNSFKVPFKDVNKLLDIQFQLVQEGVGTYEEWASRIGLVSPSAVRAGQTIETMAAALATATRQGMNSARASTSVARAFDAMSNPKTEKSLKAIGVQSRDAKGNFRPLVDVMADWRKQLEKMPNKDRIASILETLKGAGGTIEARRFLQNILLTKGGLELFQSQIKEFSTDKGAFERGYNEMANSVSAKTVRLHNAWMQVKLALGQALLPTFKKVVDGLQSLADKFDKLSPKTKEMIANAMVWGTVLAGIGGVVLLAGGAIATLAGVIGAAGIAFVPMLAIMGTIAAVATGVVVAMMALGAAFVWAYRSSAPFRAMVGSIIGFFKAAALAVMDFGRKVWGMVQTYVVPPLQQLWGVIQTQVLPAFTQFVNWAKSSLIPMLQMMADWFGKMLKPQIQFVGDMIRSQLIPAITELTDWWNRNKAVLQPLIKALVFVGGIIAMIAASPIVLLIGAIGLLIAVLRLLVTTGVNAWNGIRNAVTGAVKLAGAAIRSFMSNMRGMAADARTAWGNIKGVWNAGIASIKGAFSSAGSWLHSAGQNLVKGFINGIRSWIGNAASTAADMAHNAINAAKGALGISSPSKVFKDIGMDTIRGFTEGVKNAKTLKQLQDAMYRVTRDVQRSIASADISTKAKRAMAARWNPRLAKTTAQLTALENKRIAVQNKLAAAQKSVNDQIKTRDELAGKIRDSLAASADVSTLVDKDGKQLTNTGDMITGLQGRLKALQTFQANLRLLAKRGLDKETIAQLASQGVDSAGALVDTLAKGSELDIQKMTKLQQQIRKLAGQTGTNIAGDLYNAGIKAGQGLVKGLQSQLAAITKTMNAIAAALIKAIKKELGIKSPSRVFKAIGANTAQGYVNGYVATMNKKYSTLASATMFAPTESGTSARVGFGQFGASRFNTGGTTIYDQKITINTQEINPVKQAADLGWELTGRLN